MTKNNLPRKSERSVIKLTKSSSIANSLANITDITNSLAIAGLQLRPKAIAGLFDADPRYEPLPGVFPGPNRHWNWAEGSPPPWPPLGFVLVSFTGITSKFTNVLDSFTSKFTNVLE